ncbi:MAG: choice-of-anchor D domain-containing protein [Planctomycetes bacterium]|nr:choice-of-anchor D domain-containing protein [Planctomycetota bacterium]
MKRATITSAICLILVVLSSSAFAQIMPPDPFFESSYDFGEINVGEVATLDIIIENVGDEELKMTELNATGANADEFTVTEGIIPFNIVGGETHKIFVTFTPTAEGARTATWEFISNSPYSPNTTTLSGSALPVEIPTKPGEFSTTEDTVNFGEVLIGEQVEKSLIIENVGDEDLEITAALIAGVNAAEFSIVEGAAPFTITGGMTHEVKFLFIPTDKGERSAEIAFELANNPLPSIIMLTGMCTSSPTMIELDAMELAFGTIKIGQTSERTITIGNTGDDDLNVTAITFSGVNAADFTVTAGDAPFTVKKGETAQVTFAFAPSVEGGVNAQAEIANDYAAEPDYVSLIGIGEKEEGVIEPPFDPGPQTLEKPWDEDFRRNVLAGPLSFAHMNGLYALAGYGAMEWTGTTPAKHFYTTLSLKFATFSEYDEEPDFDATLAFLEIMGRFGIIENLEAGLKIRLGGWSGTILVPGLPPDSEGTFGLGDIFLSMKYAAIKKGELPLELSGLLTFKLPVGSQDDALGTGGFDTAFNILSSFYFMEDKLAVHMMFGFTYALDGEDIDTTAFLWGFLFNWGMGASYVVTESQDMSIALLWQLEFYDPNLSTTIGGRADLNLGGMHLMPELGLTLGLHELSADMEIFFSIGLPF